MGGFQDVAQWHHVPILTHHPAGTVIPLSVVRESVAVIGVASCVARYHGEHLFESAARHRIDFRGLIRWRTSSSSGGPGSTTSRTCRSTSRATRSSSSPGCPARASRPSRSTRSSRRGSDATSSRCRPTRDSSSARWTNPDVDFIEGLSPAVSIDQKSTSKNPRSTVGTITEVYDYLRLLYARAGRPHCPTCGSPIERQTPQQIVDKVLTLEEGQRFQVLAPVIRGRKGEYIELFRQLQAQGFSRARVNGEMHHPRRPAQARQAEEAHDRGRRRPAGGQGHGEAPAHRLGRDRAQPGRRPGGARLRRSAGQGPRARAAVQRADGLPQRAHDRHRRARAAVVLVQLAVRRVPQVPVASAPGWRSTPSWSCPTRPRRSGRAPSSRGARPTWPTTS